MKRAFVPSVVTMLLLVLPPATANADLTSDIFKWLEDHFKLRAPATTRVFRGGSQQGGAIWEASAYGDRTARKLTEDAIYTSALWFRGDVVALRVDGRVSIIDMHSRPPVERVCGSAKRGKVTQIFAGEKLGMIVKNQLKELEPATCREKNGPRLPSVSDDANGIRQWLVRGQQHCEDLTLETRQYDDQLGNPLQRIRLQDRAGRDWTLPTETQIIYGEPALSPDCRSVLYIGPR